MGNCEHNMGLALTVAVEPEQNAEAHSYTLFTNYSVRRPTFKNNCLQFILHATRKTVELSMDNRLEIFHDGQKSFVEGVVA